MMINLYVVKINRTRWTELTGVVSNNMPAAFHLGQITPQCWLKSNVCALNKYERKCNVRRQRTRLPLININSACRSVEHALRKHVDWSKSVISRHSRMIFLPPRRREARAFMSKAEREAPHDDVLCVFSARSGEIMLSRMMVMWIPVNLMVCWWWQYGMVEVRGREDPISALFLKGHTHRVHSP